jgi:hypothetical protein
MPSAAAIDCRNAVWNAGTRSPAAAIVDLDLVADRQHRDPHAVQVGGFSSKNFTRLSAKVAPCGVKACVASPTGMLT